jgi:hypothetical protein
MEPLRASPILEAFWTDPEDVQEEEPHNKLEH